MEPQRNFLSPAGAARELGVSAKALRLYKTHRLLTPGRTAAGWRCYSASDMDRAREIVALRGLGLSLAQVASALESEHARRTVLSAHATALELERQRVHGLVTRVKRERDVSSLEQLAKGSMSLSIVLPWPWGGERFEVSGLAPLTFITGPLGCGKTRLAHAIAAQTPGAKFVGLERVAKFRQSRRLAIARVDAALNRLVADGAELGDALRATLASLECNEPMLVIDMIEEGLCESTQVALAAELRRRAASGRSHIVMTRSTAMLDLRRAGPDETIIYCPANHGVPIVVTPDQSAVGYEAVATCLASPTVRARTAGAVIIRGARERPSRGRLTRQP